MYGLIRILNLVNKLKKGENMEIVKTYGIESIMKDAFMAGTILALAGQLPAPGLPASENVRRLGLLFFGTLSVTALKSLLYK